MAPPRSKTPPRPLTPGDVVVTLHVDLGGWAAAQVTGLDAAEALADVLDLDWSSPTRPESLADLGALRPLFRQAGSWGGQRSHCHYPWVLPRSCTVIGTATPLSAESSQSYGLGWGIGDALHRERLAASGRTDWNDDPAQASIEGPELKIPDGVDALTIRRLYVNGVARLDAAVLAAAFPNLTELRLHGELGELANAVALNQLTRLRDLSVTGYFGMTAADHVTLASTPELEHVDLHEYATAMHRVWRPEAANGTYLSVTGARKPGWVAENRDNPLRAWDAREGVGERTYQKSVAQFRKTRRQILAALDGAPGDRPAVLERIGSEYGEAFNAIDDAASNDLIMTEEREELYAAVVGVLDAAATESGIDLTAEQQALLDGVDATRDW
ncbi:hypothetical protein APR04_000604 [Promicromonospora umidemergens]|uniref:Leucine rich repeat (LRR) protein n=1 Tax=Promicromonospora umidemergens TaxID=629679 RepID=A0ABP8XB06_9MICO|nr:hypothetical protein [Promicromonospora umidemergens]MCP2281715.1 hypothetical protein [Promicromonospora umidemergens]